MNLNLIPIKKSVLAIGLLVTCSGHLAFGIKGSVGHTDVLPTENERAVCRMVVKMISEDNYKTVPLNDSLSALVFDRYLKTIDQNKSYLLASDVDKFSKYRTGFDEDLKTGNLSNAFTMFNTYKARYEEYLKYIISQLNFGFDFKKQEMYTPDHRTLPFMKTTAEANRLWKQRVKYDLLELELAKPGLEANKQILRQRYQALLEQSAKTTSQDVFQKFMSAFTASVDPHVAYFTPFNSAQFGIEASRSLEGIGATLALENEFVTITSLTVGGPAFKTRLINPEDRIIGIAQGKNGDFKDVFGWRLDDAIALIRGPKGTIVRLKLLPKGKSSSDEPQVVEVVRDKIILEDQSAKQEIRTYKSNGKDLKIGVITVPSFYLDYAAMQRRETNYKSTTRDVKLLLDTLKGKNVDGIMIDLRGNGGGALTEAIALTGLFIPSGPVVQVRNLSQQVQVSEDRDTTVYYNGPLSVLIDRRSASASEIFAAAIQDYGRGIILGSESYGKGSVQAQVDLDQQGAAVSGLRMTTPDGPKQEKFGQLNVTIGKFYRITGSSTQHKGVTPDIEMPAFIAKSRYGEDNEASAMPWDTIAKSNFTKVGSMEHVLPKLTEIYIKRSQTSPAFKAYDAMIKSYKENESVGSISLNEQGFKSARSKSAEKALAQTNQLRLAIGLPALNKGAARPAAEDLDFVKQEAGQILTDYIQINSSPTVGR